MAQPEYSDTCARPSAAEPLDPQGCALFGGVQPGVDFEIGTANLTDIARSVLKLEAFNLRQHPELVVEIRVHTERFADPDLAASLARERAIAVARFLATEGVNVQRLRARAFGSTQPRASNATDGGRRLNNRVEFRVL